MAMSDELEVGLLNLLAGNAVPALSILAEVSNGISPSGTTGDLFLSLHKSSVGEGGNQTTNEVDLGGSEFDNYAREPLPRTLGGGDDWTVAANVLSNTSDVVYALDGGMGSTVVVTHWAIGTHATGAGHVLWHGAFVQAPKLFTAIAADDLLHSAAHGFTLQTETLLVFSAPGGTLPSPLVEGTVYYPVTPVASLNGLQLSATQGGAAIDLTTSGSGWIAKLTALTIQSGVQPKITAGTLQVQLF